MKLRCWVKFDSLFLISEEDKKNLELIEIEDCLVEFLNFNSIKLPCVPCVGMEIDLMEFFDEQMFPNDYYLSLGREIFIIKKVLIRKKYLDIFLVNIRDNRV